VSGNKPLVTMSFETARVDANGNVKRLPDQTANGYIEQLPGGVMLEMVEISGGSYLMGTNDAEAPRLIQEIKRYYDKGNDAERLTNFTMPQHLVTVGDFYMGKYEVTQGQWKAVMGSLPPKLSVRGGEFKGEDLPVVNVSWDEAKEFIEKLNRLTGGEYRLPSEAEWEYGARGGSQEAFSFGPAIRPGVANYNNDIRYGHPIRVGSYPANAYGLYDMHGSVLEWCEDDWHDSYRGAPVDRRAWVNISNRAPYRVLRGGSWADHAVNCRSALRGNYSPGVRDGTIGFRLSRTASEM
jgi:formylglycine-generating enzyme required for sulfatase activity